ncbi:hypothetical protein SAMN05444267_10892 [Chryseobacterium polytrichastri]|uniref:Uncharacterized protein n=1 Tax=Chryseobacterium polytrichastri TaxID=1302687 RepID=A0A1M7L8U2_9FLAO|nr:hypothetical protein SAMN05444267_10892 [Chryseobacterium polytrichastri]
MAQHKSFKMSLTNLVKSIHFNDVICKFNYTRKEVDKVDNISKSAMK